MISLAAHLERAASLLVARLEDLERRILQGEGDSAWPSYVEALTVLAHVATQLSPEHRGQLLTTAQLAERLQMAPKTIRAKAKRGELTPVRLGQRGRGSLRWRA